VTTQKLHDNTSKADNQQPVSLRDDDNELLMITLHAWLQQSSQLLPNAQVKPSVVLLNALAGFFMDVQAQEGAGR
jgi:hypothetical protein